MDKQSDRNSFAILSAEFKETPFLISNVSVIPFFFLGFCFLLLCAVGYFFHGEFSRYLLSLGLIICSFCYLLYLPSWKTISIHQKQETLLLVYVLFPKWKKRIHFKDIADFIIEQRFISGKGTRVTIYCIYLYLADNRYIKLFEFGKEKDAIEKLRILKECCKLSN